MTKLYGAIAYTLDNQVIEMEFENGNVLTHKPILNELRKAYGNGIEFVECFEVIEWDDSDSERFNEYTIENKEC